MRERKRRLYSINESTNQQNKNQPNVMTCLVISFRSLCLLSLKDPRPHTTDSRKSVVHCRGDGSRRERPILRSVKPQKHHSTVK